MHRGKDGRILIFKATVDLLRGRHYNTNRNHPKRGKTREF